MQWPNRLALRIGGNSGTLACRSDTVKPESENVFEFLREAL